MLHFRNDYGNGAHPLVLEALCKTNLELTVGYGMDHHCQQAADRIRQLCERPEADVHFLVGGTQANKVALDALLRPWEAVIATDSGHIQVHEAGAIEHNGHRIYQIPHKNGKLEANLVQKVCQQYGGDETSPAPRVVYISNTTEFGTVYSRQELVALRRVCDDNGLLLYCDGARLGCALVASDLRFSDYAALCDAFTIGGTKNGLLFGEALVISDPKLCPAFRRCLKQQGAMLAKGRLLGVQFLAALENDLYQQLGRQAMAAADMLREGLQALQIPQLIQSPSNQLFPILPHSVIEALRETVSFEHWCDVDEDHSCIRFVTAWHTTAEEVRALLAQLKALLSA